MRSRVSSARQVQRELVRVFADRAPEGLVVVGFGADLRIRGMAVNQQHRALSWMKVWELVGIADDLGADSVVVLLYPAGLASCPSAHELAVFRDLQVRAGRAGLPLVDCLVWRGNRMWSLRELSEERVGA